MAAELSKIAQKEVLIVSGQVGIIQITLVSTFLWSRSIAYEVAKIAHRQLNILGNLGNDGKSWAIEMNDEKKNLYEILSPRLYTCIMADF